MGKSSGDPLRDEAVKRLKKKAEFKQYLFVWAAVSAIVTAVWFFATPGAYFWPLWVMFGMGIGAVFAGWDAYGRSRVATEADIQAEMKKLSGD
jgi:uncharacterized membrane protein